MRQTAAERSYVGSRAAPLHCSSASCHGIVRRHGLTLIEVVVAMSILVVVVLALLSSYTFYYRSITNLRIQSIGENLAQLQLEDVRNMGVQSLGDMLGGNWVSATSPPIPLPARSPLTYDCPNYPPAELFYTSDSSTPSGYITTPYWYSYPRPKVGEAMGLGPPSNLPQWYPLLPVPLTPPPDGTTIENLEQNLASVWYNGAGVPIKYDSGMRDADFVVEGLTGFVLNGSSTNPSELVLPDSITVTPSTPSASYTLDISKWTYPYFKKSITITDETLGEADLSKKLYEVAVTVYWTANGAKKTVTVKQEVSFEGQS